MKIKTVFLIISFILICTSCLFPVHAEASQGILNLGTITFSDIASDSFNVNIEKQTTIWSGNVKAISDNMTMTCETLVAQYIYKTGAKGAEKTKGDIEGITATVGVHITGIDGDGIPYDISAEKLVYNRSDNKMVLTGEPVLKYGKNLLEDVSKITVTFKKNEITNKDEIADISAQRSPDKQVHMSWHPEEEKK
jgi:lipopolysaccharide export system protein LptA